MFSLLGTVITLAVLAVGFWIYGSMNSLHPQKTDEARDVARKLHNTADPELADAIRALTIGEFHSYFVGLKPPLRLTHPVEARTYGGIALKWSRPTMFHRTNRALVALAEVYTEEAARLSHQ